jgi:hypothetical protein
MRVDFSSLFDVLFGCDHRFGFPITRPGTHYTYQTCLRCGAEFEYDWKTMSRGQSITPTVSRESASLKARPVRTA